MNRREIPMTAKWLWISMAFANMLVGQTQAGPALAVDAAAARLPISPDIYGLNNYFFEENILNADLRPDFSAARAGAAARADRCCNSPRRKLILRSRRLYPRSKSDQAHQAQTAIERRVLDRLTVDDRS